MHSDLLESNAQAEKIHKEDIGIDVNNICDDGIEIFESEDEMQQSLTRLCYGDLYIIGRIWIETVKTLLIGTNFNLIPVVSAAAKIETPQKPPPMKYTDLPLYKSPHYEYKDYIEDKKKCPKAKVRLLHQYLLPKVKYYRKCFEKTSREAKIAMLNAYHEVSTSVNDSKKNFKKIMRDPNNLTIRQAVVLAGGTAGYLLGSGRGVPRRLFCTGLGLLSAGALCFPKETDSTFREFTHQSSKMVLAFYNNLYHTSKGMGFRQRMPCKEDIPPIPLPKQSQCTPKK